MAKGYATISDLEAYLQRALTPGQQAAFGPALEGVEVFIDRKTGQSWGTAVVTAENHVASNEVVTLRGAPVTSVESVTAYSANSPVGVVLVPDVDYRLIDGTVGQLWVRGDVVVSYNYFLVSYTTPADVPKDVKLAATLMVAQFMAPALNNGSVGIKSYSIDGESVTFQESSVPRAALEILEDFSRVGPKRRFIFA